MKPTTYGEWATHLAICNARLQRLRNGHGSDTNARFYVPTIILWMFAIQDPDEDLLTFVTLLRDFYLSHVTPDMIAFERPISSLDTKANVESALLEAVKCIVQATPPAYSSASLTQDITQALKEEVEELQKSQMTLVVGRHEDIPTVARACELYFICCILHPDVDEDGTKAEWLNGVYMTQPQYVDLPACSHPRTSLHAEETLPGLEYLMRESLSHDGDDFVRVFEAFGRWILTIALCGEYALPNRSRSVDRFLVDVADEVSDPLSPIPLYLRAAICNIDMRQTYRAMIFHAHTLIESDPDLERVDVMAHRMFRWVLTCTWNLELDTSDKNRVLSWAYRSNVVRIFSSLNPVGVEIPGQRVLSRLSVLWAPIDTPQSDEEEDTYPEGLTDVYFEPESPELKPVHYSESVGMSTLAIDELCVVCMGCLAEDSQQKMRMYSCGHLSHEDCLCTLINGIHPWSNKCPACRRRICPPRARRAVIAADDEDDGQSDDENINEHDPGVDLSDIEEYTAHEIG